MKAYTDIEQSKKLAEILPIESADGFYEAQLNPTTDEWEYILFTGNEWASEEVVIPCWSLAALLLAGMALAPAVRAAFGGSLGNAWMSTSASASSSRRMASAIII